MSAEGDGDPVVVPWAPGRVLRPDPAPPSDVDVVLDELFGPPDDGGPGWFDVVLLVAGAVLLVRGLHGLGVVALVLGLAIPVRSVVRRGRRAARRRSYRALIAAGQPIATGHLDTDALLAAYDALLDTARGAPEWIADEAVAAAHRALVECASLLGGRVPSIEEEVAYVRRRTSAITTVVAAITTAPDLERIAAVRARDEVDALSGPTSLDDLGAVARRAGA